MRLADFMVVVVVVMPLSPTLVLRSGLGCSLSHIPLPPSTPHQLQSLNTVTYIIWNARKPDSSSLPLLHSKVKCASYCAIEIIDMVPSLNFHSYDSKIEYQWNNMSHGGSIITS